MYGNNDRNNRDKKRNEELLRRVKEELDHQWQLGYHFGRCERTEEYDREEADNREVE